MEYIRLKNMIFYGYHGVEEYEKNTGARFEVDIELQCDLSQALKSDALEDTINYEQVYKIIHKIVTSHNFFLIEALAYRIGTELKTNFDKIHGVKTVVRKPHAPIRGVLDTIEVEVTL